MGEVYLAQDMELHRLVAIKTLRQEVMDDEAVRKRIERECLLHAKVGPHPNIVTLFDRFEEDSRLALVMEYVDGETLQTRLELNADEGVSMTMADAVKVAGQMLEALSRIHQHDIVHRDIKPANIMLSRDHSGRISAKLMDFGIARINDDETQYTQLTTDSRAALGTPLYMAPEQIDSATFGQVSPATDIYAVGIVLYHMVCGQPPFQGTLTEILNGHLNRPVTPPRFKEDCPAAKHLGPVLKRAMAKKPAERYGSAKEFLATLQTLTDGGPRNAAETVVLSAEDLPRAGEQESRGAKRPVPWPYVAGMALAVILGSCAVLWGLTRQTPEAPEGDPVPVVEADSVKPPVVETESAPSLEDAVDPIELAPPIEPMPIDMPAVQEAATVTGAEGESAGLQSGKYLPMPDGGAGEVAEDAVDPLHGDTPDPMAGISFPEAPAAGAAACRRGAAARHRDRRSGDVHHSAERLAVESGGSIWHQHRGPRALEHDHQAGRHTGGQVLYLYERPDLPEVEIDWGDSPPTGIPTDSEGQQTPAEANASEDTIDTIDPIPAEEEPHAQEAQREGILQEDLEEIAGPFLRLT